MRNNLYYRNFSPFNLHKYTDAASSVHFCSRIENHLKNRNKKLFRFDTLMDFGMKEFEIFPERRMPIILQTIHSKNKNNF